MNAPTIPVTEHVADLDSGATENEFPNGDDLAICRATDFYSLDELLTDQERSVLRLIGEGLTNRQIGAEMYLAEKTVKNYVSSLLHKLGLGRRTEAAVYATERRQHGRTTR